jgi:hypothetical protein
VEAVALAETIVLDPAEVDPGRFELDITSWISSEGVDWGDAEIAAYMAEQARGSSPVDFRVPNRTITVPFALKDRGGVSFDVIREQVQAKAALFQQEGGRVKRVLSNGGTVYADVTNATLKLSGGWGQAHRDYDTEATLTLEAIPDFYGNEITLNDHVETAAAELVFTEAQVLGDHPGRVRIVVDEDDGEDQLGLIWGFRSRHYSSAATARLVYEAEALGPVAPAAGTALAGASGGTVVYIADVATGWTPLLDTRLGGTAYLTHEGSYRVWARCRSIQGTAVQVRLVWDVGDLTLPVENTAVTIPGTEGPFYALDFGEVRLDAPPVGTHRWHGVFQAKGESGGESASIDRVWFQPLDEGAGRLRVASQALEPGLTGYSARDEFNQTAGALAGKTAPAGGVWAGAGDTDDFSVETTGKTAQRTAVSDADANTGRYAVSGVAAFAVQVVQIDVKRAAFGSNSSAEILDMGALARYTNTSNWLMAHIDVVTGTSSNPEIFEFRVRKRVAGTVTTLKTVAIGSFSHSSYWLNASYTIRLSVDAAGRWSAWWYQVESAAGDPIAQGQDTDLATGGVLASGKPGFYDAKQGSTAQTRNADNFLAWSPERDAIIHASQSAELRWNGMFREDSAGAGYGPVSHVIGDLPRIPPSGLEGRTVETFLKASRGDLVELPDGGIDDISARIYYQPSYLFVPAS